MDASGKIIVAKHNEISVVDLKKLEGEAPAEPVKDRFVSEWSLADPLEGAAGDWFAVLVRSRRGGFLLLAAA